MDPVQIVINGTVVADAAVFLADASGNPTGSPVTPDGPFEFVIGDTSIASFEQTDNGEAKVTGLAEGSTGILANCTVGGKAAVPVAGTITVVRDTTNDTFVTTITFGDAQPPVA